MGEKEVNAYAKGFQRGWNDCREKICMKFNLDIDKVIAWEMSDKEFAKNKSGGKSE